MSIRVTLDGQRNLPTPTAEPIPAKVLAFWHAEDRSPPPWRYSESPNEQLIREQAERDSSWAGL
jgi:hypothetical protein